MLSCERCGKNDIIFVPSLDLFVCADDDCAREFKMEEPKNLILEKIEDKYHVVEPKTNETDETYKTEPTKKNKKKNKNKNKTKKKNKNKKKKKKI